MTTPSEPDSGVDDNPDLGRLFQLFLRSGVAQQRILSDLRDTAQRQLHIAQSYMSSPGASQQAYQARRNFGGASNPRAGQTASQAAPNGGDGGVWTVGSSGVVTPPGGGPGPRVVQGTVIPQAGPPVGGTTLSSLIQTHTRFPTTAAGWNATYSAMAADTGRQLRESLSRAGLGVWSPYWDQRPRGGNGNGGGGGFGGGGSGGQMGAGPYGMGPAGLPPQPALYFGGPGSPMGPYGPYGPYGPSTPSGGSHGGGGHAGGGGHGGGGGGVLGWLGSHVPGVSLVTSILGETRSQREKNEYYQNIEGGSNFAGFGERMHEEAYAASTSGVFSGDEARAAFKGVSRLGYNGRVDDVFSGQGGRQDVLNFIYHAKTSYGASVNESLRTLELVSKNSTLSLNGLQKALKDVSDTAGRAGVNAQMARSQLKDLVQFGVQAGYGAGAIPTAANLQMGKASLGRSYEDIDLTGQMSQQYAYMASSNLGMTYNQYTAMQSGNPLAAAQARAGQNLSLLSQIFTQDEISWVKQKAQALGGTLDPNAALEIVPDFLRAFPNHNISVIQQQLAAFGIVNTDDPQKAVAYAFNLIAGNNGDLANAQKTQRDTQVVSMAKAAKAAKTQGKDSAFFNKSNMDLDQMMSQGNAFGTYVTEVNKSGKRNPVIENLLQHVDDQDKTKVIVHTASGQRVMSLSDAIKEHPQEISSGSVQFVAGDEKGKTVSDIVGSGSVNLNANWQSEAAKSSSRTGQSLSSWQKDNRVKSTAGTGTGTGANGKVVVDLTDAAKQLLKVSSATGIAGANGEGAPPLNSYNWNASR